MALARRVFLRALAACGLVAGFLAALNGLRGAGRFVPLHLSDAETYVLLAAAALAGAILCYLTGPFLFDRALAAIRWSEARLGRVPGVDLLAGAVGTIVGLTMALLLGPALSRIPLVGDYLPAVVSLALAYLGWNVFMKKREDWQRLSLLPRRSREERSARGERAASADEVDSARGVPGAKVLDTSAIIDGRIADLCQTGFIEGTLVIPQFVLDELRRVADSADPLRRNRGRRGLDLLATIQKDRGIPVLIYEHDPGAALDVDIKLVHVARELDGKVVTTDYNLNKVAALRGVPVLNVNDLVRALKPVVLPGEELSVRLLREGNQTGQGVGYLDDGTMVVVEGGKRHIGSTVDVEVTSALQTSAGKMIFGRVKPAARAVGR